MLSSIITRELFKHTKLPLPLWSCNIVQRHNYAFWFSNNDTNLQQAINNAEKLVGYPTSFSSLKYLVDEEPTNFLALAKKMVGSGHPLLTTARDLLSQDPYSSHQLGGLWVLLLSRAAHSGHNRLLEDDFVNGIHQKQRTLSETTELINTAFLIHRSMLDLQSTQYLQEVNKSTLRFGNNLSVLGGDFLLAKASTELAKLQNTKVVEMVSIAIGDLAHGASLEALSDDTEENLDLMAWEKMTYLMKGSLMAHSCKAALVLNETANEEKGTSQDVDVKNQMQQENAFEFGRNLVLAQQAAEDIETFQNKKQLLKPTNILLILALQENESLKEKYMNLKENSDPLTLSRDLKLAIEYTRDDLTHEVRKYCELYIEKCKVNISLYPHQETVNAINRILDTIRES